MRNIFIFAIFLFTAHGPVNGQEVTPLELDYHKLTELVNNNLAKGADKPGVLEKTLKAKEHYYRYLMNHDTIDFVKEVEDNFEDAVKKAEEKFEMEDLSISQSDILKLKMGLVGVKKELNELEKDMAKVKVDLLNELGLDRNIPLLFSGKGLTKLKIDIPSLETCIEIAKKKHTAYSLPELEKAHINLREKDENVKFIEKGRKFSRGLLVVALANFDMGIGEGKDLFEALYIYNRAVKDFVNGKYQFNLAALELFRVIGEELMEKE